MQNCWTYYDCGRQPGGDKASELGICPATTDVKLDGLNNGKNGGRICWAVSGTFCGGEAQGTNAQKLPSCISCDFFRLVHIEEGNKFTFKPYGTGMTDQKNN
jgi:hypothetical protein